MPTNLPRLVASVEQRRLVKFALSDIFQNQRLASKRQWHIFHGQCSRGQNLCSRLRLPHPCQMAFAAALRAQQDGAIAGPDGPLIHQPHCCGIGRRHQKIIPPRGHPVG